MDFIKFSIRIPKELCKPLDDHARKEHLNRTQAIIRMLEREFRRKAQKRAKARAEKAAALN